MQAPVVNPVLLVIAANAPETYMGAEPMPKVIILPPPARTTIR